MSVENEVSYNPPEGVNILADDEEGEGYHLSSQAKEAFGIERDEKINFRRLRDRLIARSMTKRIVASDTYKASYRKLQDNH